MFIPIMALIAILSLLVAVRLVVFRLIGPGRNIDAKGLIAGARGRAIVVGERHDDRAGLAAVLALMRRAHESGYRALGVEICEGSDGDCSGLREELELLRRRSADALDEHDDRSSLDPGPDGLRPRMNRHWQMREALRLGWRIVPIDPHHWNWRLETAYGYLDSREPAMADVIRTDGPMIAVCGYGHLGGLERLLGDAAVYATASAVKRSDVAGVSFWYDRIAYAATLPRLVA